MNAKQKANAIEKLDKLKEAVADGRVAWMALSIKFKDGATLAIHSEGAPKRPRGLS